MRGVGVVAIGGSAAATDAAIRIAASLPAHVPGDPHDAFHEQGGGPSDGAPAGGARPRESA
jgi:hypothetical protein